MSWDKPSPQYHVTSGTDLVHVVLGVNPDAGVEVAYVDQRHIDATLDVLIAWRQKAKARERLLARALEALGLGDTAIPPDPSTVDLINDLIDAHWHPPVEAEGSDR